LVINGTSGKDTYSIRQNIKAQITNEKNLVDHKEVGPVKITNCTHIIFLTNNDNAIKIETDDQRFAAIECYNELANNKDKSVNEIKSKKVNMCVYKWLLSIDSDNYNFSGNIPQTDLYEEMQSMNIPPLVFFTKHSYYKC
jgi:hypothetical protein